MKKCPKCEGRYFDDMYYCSECMGGNVIELVTEEEYKNKTGKGFETLNKIKLEREIKDKEYEKKHPIRQRYYQPHSKQKTVEENIPKCPTCSSTNIEKISSFDKAAGAVMFGLFSKTARSQFKCRNCGYKW